MFRTLLSKELREQRRTHRLLIVALVLLVSGMLSPLLAKYTPLLLSSLPGVPPSLAALIPQPTILDSFTQFVKNVSQFGVILVIILTMGALAQEIERGTASMLLTKPVRRSAVIMAKWSAGVLSVLGGMILATLGFTFYTLVLFEPFSLVNLAVLTMLMTVFLIFFLTLALLASTLARTQAAAAGLAFGSLVLVLVVSAIPGINNYLPSKLLSWGLSLFSFSPETAWPALISSLALIVLFLVIAILRFSREEI